MYLSYQQLWHLCLSALFTGFRTLFTAFVLQERLAAQREEVRRRAAEIDDALAELDEHRREAEHREKLLAAEDERLADALSQARLADFN